MRALVLSLSLTDLRREGHVAVNHEWEIGPARLAPPRHLGYVFL